MQLKNAKKFKSLQPGINSMKMTEWSITESNYGKQLFVKFGYEINTKDGIIQKEQQYWNPFKAPYTGEPETGKMDSFMSMFAQKLEEYVDVLAAYVGVPNAKKHQAAIEAVLFEQNIDIFDKDSVQNAEEQYISELFKLFPADYTSRPINVILHYNGQYLNIPKYKDNSYKIPFGLNPTLGNNLVYSKAEPMNPFAQASESSEDLHTEIPVEMEEIPVGLDPIPDVPGVTAANPDDLPF
jgi:hypothetical protein